MSKWLEASAMTLVLAASSGAVAQNNVPQTEERREIADIIVTGSRAVTDPLTSPTPLTVIKQEENQLAKPGAPIDSLVMIPALSSSNSSRNAQSIAGSAQGADVLNLRNLGGSRTLVLLDGRRLFATGLDGTTDVRLVPQALISRVDIVTGGASAAYGSDAVSGVVNMILDTKFTGIKGSIQGGISDHGDGESQRAELTFGTSFADERGHILASITAANSEPVYLETERKWGRRGLALVNIPGATPPNQRFENVGVVATNGGVILSGPLTNTQFLPGGRAAPYTPGSINLPLYVVGSPDAASSPGTIAPDLRVLNPFLRLSYDFSDQFKPYVQAMGSINRIRYALPGHFELGPFAYTIFSGNPYIPQTVQDQMTAQNIASFRLSRASSDLPGRSGLADQKNYVFDIVTGATGRIGSSSWNYDVFFDYGRSQVKAYVHNNLNRDHLYAAADAVIDPTSGNIVCRSMLTNPGARPGCVPINLFGVGSPSPEAVAYVSGTSYWNLVIKQKVFSASANGELFSTGAGPVKAALGFEYRKVDMRQTADPFGTALKNADRAVRGYPASLQNTAGLWEVANNGPTQGSYNIKEAFAEVNVPLLRDSPLGKSLDVNGAIRYADYSTSDGVTTWKLGIAYQPVDDLRLRGTYSRDIRAANLGELYTATTSGAGNVVDTITGRGTTSVLSQIVGNPALTPEKAKTYTLGSTYRPSWLPGFGLTVDYYNISMKDAIQFISTQQTVDQCRDGSAVACSLIDRDANGNISVIRTPYLNLATLKTSGLEAEMSYAAPLAGGNLSLRLMVLHVAKYQTRIPGGVIIDTAGEIGPGAGTGTAALNTAVKWRGTFRLTYQYENFTFFAQERYIGHGTYDKTKVEGVTIDDNHVPARFYTDITTEYKFSTVGNGLTAFFTVNNLFDREPPAIPSPSAIFRPYTNGLLYDKMGRYYTLGLRFQF